MLPTCTTKENCLLPYQLNEIELNKILEIAENKFTFLNISLLFSIALTFVAGIFSGNVFDEWICTLFLGFMCGCLLLNLKKKES